MRRITPLLLVLASSMLHAGSLINFVTTQDEGITTKKGGTFNAYLKLGVGAKPTTLKVTLGNKDVTSLFSLGPCGTSPCEVSATLTQANGVLAGWNFLAATIQGTMTPSIRRVSASTPLADCNLLVAAASPISSQSRRPRTAASLFRLQISR